MDEMLIPPSGLSPQEDCGVFSVIAVGVGPVEDQPAIILVTVKVTAPGEPAISIPGQSPDEQGAIPLTARFVAPVTGAATVVMVMVC